MKKALLEVLVVNAPNTFPQLKLAKVFFKDASSKQRNQESVADQDLELYLKFITGQNIERDKTDNTE